MRKLSILLISIIFGACENDPPLFHSSFELNVPNGFPEPKIPSDNPMLLESFELGKRLFYDPILSLDSTISCGSCHKQAYAFADNVAVSPGVEQRQGTRNSMSLANVAYYDFFMREGGVPSLEMQVLAPIEEHSEMGFNIVLAAERLQADSTYVAQSKLAYNRTPDPFVITRAIACFERSLLSGNSRYDQHLLNETELRGKALFYSDSLACSSCHGSFLFTNQSFENNGLYTNYVDSGKYRLTYNEADIGVFKVPTLRNIEYTAPYMHDGSINTLPEVISHYASGGKQHFNQSTLIQGFELNTQEEADLIEFLKSLSDESFLQNKLFEE